MTWRHTPSDVSSDVTEVKAVTDNIPDSGAMTSIAQESTVSGVSTDTTAIKAVTDNIPNSGTMSSIAQQATLVSLSLDTDKIDAAATDGLAGTSNSLAYRMHEAERHLHSWERWFGLAVTPDGEVHRADSINDGTAVAPFVIDAGNDVWGSWVQILGSSDTPAITGSAYFDLHRLMIVAVENANSIHFLQLGFGTSGAASLTAGTYTEVVFQPLTVQGQETILIVQMRRRAVGTKGWARLLARGENTSTASFYFGLHEYEG